MTLPHITTARTRLTVLPPERACLMLDFYQRNRVHLAPWEPRRDESFYTLGHWQGQGESVNILLNFTQFFETRIEYRFQIFTAHSCDFLLPSYARLA